MQGDGVGGVGGWSLSNMYIIVVFVVLIYQLLLLSLYVLHYVVAYTKIFLLQNEDIKDICLALPCLHHVFGL
jgi:hypothetical protein